jgi:PAS domain S-box-containing protein
MNDIQSLTEQRDRFIAFAFAASDVLIETNEKSKVSFATGSIKSILGLTEKQFIGANLLSFIAPSDRTYIKEYFQRLKTLKRTGEVRAKLISGNGTTVPVAISGMASPNHQNIYNIVIKKVPLSVRASSKKDKESPMSIMDFANSSALLIEQANEADENLNLALYDVILHGTTDEQNEMISQDFVQTMRAWSAGGSGVSQVDDGKFSLLLDHSIDPNQLSSRLEEVAQNIVPNISLEITSNVLNIDDLVDMDDICPMIENALNHFVDVGAEAMELDDIKGQSKQPNEPTLLSA